MARNVAPIFADIDGMDADKFISHLTPDVRFRFANMDPAIGHAATRDLSRQLRACLERTHANEGVNREP